MISSPRSFVKNCAFVAFLLLPAVVTAQTTTGEASPIAAPTVPVGSNPDFTPDPDTQKGTLGPTAQINTQKFGETFSPAPTIATDPPTTTSAYQGPPSQPPAILPLTAVGTAMAGIVVAGAMV